MARSVICETSRLDAGEVGQLVEALAPTMVESMSAISSRLRRCSASWTQTSTGARSSTSRGLGAGDGADRRARRRCPPRRRPGCRCPAIGEPAPATASSACGRCFLKRVEVLGDEGKDDAHGRSRSETRIWLIAGPTASGKSALALRLAQMIGGEIVNADSMQLYADLRGADGAAAPRGDAAGAAPPLRRRRRGRRLVGRPLAGGGARGAGRHRPLAARRRSWSAARASTSGR